MVICVKSLQKRLLTATESAYLYGIKRDNDLVLYTSLTSPQWEPVLPVPFVQVGLFVHLTEPSDDIPSSLLSSLPDQDEDFEVVACRINDSLSFFTFSDGTLTPEAVSFVSAAQLNLVSLKVTMPLDLVMSKSRDKLKLILQAYRDRLGSAASSFLLDGSNFLWIGGEKARLIGMPSDSTVDDVINTRGGAHQLGFTLLWSSLPSENTKACAPIIYLGKKSSNTVHRPLRLTALAYIEQSAPAEEIPHVLITALLKQLDSLEALMSSRWSEGRGWPVPELLHLEPLELEHYVSLVLDTQQTDEELRKLREELHKTFFLPKDRPYFRRWNALGQTNSSYLVSPHKAVSNPAGYGAENVWVVKGNYVYHHYLQDGMSDSGWGCAYRSLQTLVSWFRLQGYTDKKPPSHGEIQKCLVDIGDKPTSFQGSRQWVGSFEVSFVLQSHLGIKSYIMTVQRGAQMPRHAPQLIRHFQEIGTPIMIGGDVLAHTILGVAWKEDTPDDLELLILDPHYEGEENLTTVVRKGWCGWKKMSFWKQDAFYNLCLPQRPLAF